MPFIFPGSSEQLTPALAPLPEPTAEVRDKLAALSIDEPLPDTYAGDRIRLLVQSPYRLYLYWSHARDPFQTLRRLFGTNHAARYRLALRLTDIESGAESLFEASPVNNFWFDVRPDSSYRVAVGFYAQGRPFIRLLISNEVTTPRVGVARTSDATPEFHVAAPEFARVLNEAGYATDALEVTLEAADAATGDETTRRLADAFIGAGAPLLRDDSFAEMRALLSALAFGVSLERLLPLLSPALAGWLRQAAQREAAPPDASRLLELLRSTLALELEDDERYDEATAEAMRRAARFVWGASDVQMPAPGPRLWLPSMNEEFFKRRARRRNI
ncbi:MAG TPA: DUF4912 domain-containing protein [Pyrinomonadaceae bacterium]|nr:DUF4912 domain-containing protein [Pyrinomonadaceae bacterium]